MANLSPGFIQTLQEWAKRSDFVQVKAPSLSHYTDAAGLIGICSSNRLWATCAQYSNDRSEVIYAHEVARSVAPQVFARPLTESTERLKNHVSEMIDNLAERNDAYVVSFCESTDLLSQWRAYGRNAGFEIRFDSLTAPSQYLNGTEVMILENPLNGRALLAKVTYDPERQRDQLRNILERAFGIVEVIEAETPEHRHLAPGAMATLLSIELSSWLHRVKHPKFEEEGEWRAIVFPGEKRPNALSLTDLPRRFTTLDYEKPEQLRFRTGRHYIVPYCELKPNGKLPMKEVICGPGGHETLTQKAVRLLLLSSGFTGVEVRNSDVPLSGA